jgi:dsRNA-specific ribonuclease
MTTTTTMSKSALILLNDLAVKKQLQVNTFFTIDQNNKGVFQCVIQVGMLYSNIHQGSNKKEAKKLAAEEMLGILAMTPIF